MSTQPKTQPDANTLQGELKAEQALGLIGLGLMQKMQREGNSEWVWNDSEDGGQADLNSLRQRLELTNLAIQTGAPLTTAEVSHLLGARPGSGKAERGGLIANRISRNVWKLTRSENDSPYWRN